MDPASLLVGLAAGILIALAGAWYGARRYLRAIDR